MSRRRLSNLPFAVLGLALVAGCAASPTSQSTALRDAVTDYVNSMRWGHIEKAAKHVPDASREAFLKQKRMAQSQVQLHEYDVRSVDYTVGTPRARVIVFAVWSRPADPVTHNEVLEQSWLWQDAHWQLIAQKAVPKPDQAIEPGDAL